MVPDAVGEFFAIYSFPFAVGGGDFSCWCGIHAGRGEFPPPHSPVSRYGAYYASNTAAFDRIGWIRFALFEHICYRAVPVRRDDGREDIARTLVATNRASCPIRTRKEAS